MAKTKKQTKNQKAIPLIPWDNGNKTYLRELKQSMMKKHLQQDKDKDKTNVNENDAETLNHLETKKYGHH